MSGNALSAVPERWKISLIDQALTTGPLAGASRSRARKFAGGWTKLRHDSRAVVGHVSQRRSLSREQREVLLDSHQTCLVMSMPPALCSGH